MNVRGTTRQHHDARVLQAAIGIRQLRAYGSNSVTLGNLNQRQDWVGLVRGYVIVQQEEELAMCVGSADVDGLGKIEDTLGWTRSGV